jgi:D-arabinose 1-dehydrogenase-like Zn-dependent alcohol dehydrogenase
VRAVQYDAIGAPWRVGDVLDPTPPEDGVVLKVEAAGLCRSDWHGWHGHDNVSVFPHVPGHEFAGTVAAVGPGVTRWREGDRVTVPFVCACGRCLVCESGNHQVCPHQWQPGFDGWGGFAEYVALPAADVNLVRLPASIGFEVAAALGCRVATAYRAVATIGRANAGDSVVVHGAGGVGLAAVMIARALGGRVVVVDPSEDAREAALGLGAAAALAPGDDLLDAIVEATDGGPTLSLDAIGDSATCRASIESLRPRGRHVQVGLLPAGTAVDPVPMHRVVARELEVLGSHGLAAHDYPELLQLVESGRLRPDLLIGQTIELDGVPDAFALIGTPDQPPGITVVRASAT